MRTAASPIRLPVSGSFSLKKSAIFWVFDVCLIVDANVAPKFLVQSSAIIDWLFGQRGTPRLVAAGKLREELAKSDGVRRQLVQLDRAGRLRSADPKRLQPEEKRLRAGATCASND